MAKKVKKEQACSLDEEMLLWTSYRYCIGRHTYVGSLSYYMAEKYYPILSDERKEHNAMDIRMMIMDSLRYMPFNLKIHRWYAEEAYDPLSTLFLFIEQEDIKSMEELLQYCEIEYDAHDKTYKSYKRIPEYKSFETVNDFEDLLNWDELAALFDVKRHMMITLTNGEKVEAFRFWKRKSHQVGENLYQNNEFGWEYAWRPVEEYVAGKHNVYIPESSIESIEKITLE